MAVIKHDAEFYQNASEDLIEDLVNEELESMCIDVGDEEIVDDNVEYFYNKSFNAHDDDDDVIFATNSLPDPTVNKSFLFKLDKTIFVCYLARYRLDKIPRDG